MTIEDKAQAYDTAIRKAQDIFHTSEFVKITDLFPELAESEDERITRAINNMLPFIPDEAYANNGVTKEGVLDWLEKQKETSHISEMCKENADSFTEDERIRQWLYNLVDEGAYLCERPFATESILSYLEKQKERGPLTKEEEYTLHRIIEYLEDETCPSEWISLLHGIYCLPYGKQKESAEKEYVFRPLGGTDITVAAEQAIKRVNEGERLVLAFNGAYIPVLKGYDVNEIVDIYNTFVEKKKEPPFVKDVNVGYPGYYFYDGNRMYLCSSPALEEKQKEQKPVPSRETILGIWELGNFWKENPEARDGLTQLKYIQKYWNEKCDYQKEQKPINNSTREKIISRAISEKQVVLISESNGSAEIGWDTRSLEDTKKLLECGLAFINKNGINPAKKQKPISKVFGFKVGDAVRLKDGDGRKHIIKSFEEVEGLHGPNFYHVEFEDNSARDSICPGEECPNSYYTQMEKFEDEQKPVKCIDFDNEFENQVSHLLASVLNGEWVYNEGFVKHAAQSLLGSAKHELELDGKALLYTADKSYQIGFRDGVASVKPAEWSEEDEEMYARVVRRYTDYEGVIMRTKEESVATKMLDAMAQEEIWLKSLHPSWKPSEEQMEALKLSFEDAFDDAGDCNRYRELKLLYEQLKKL